MDTVAVLTNIKLIQGSQKFLLNRILPDSLKGGYLEKTLKAHDNSLIYFYTNFHGYKIAYFYYVVYRDEEILPRVYKHNLWVDTNSNIVLESMPYILSIVFTEGQPLARNDQRKVFIKKWWPDSLPKDIDSIELQEYFQHKINEGTIKFGPKNREYFTFGFSFHFALVLIVMIISTKKG